MHNYSKENITEKVTLFKVTYLILSSLLEPTATVRAQYLIPFISTSERDECFGLNNKKYLVVLSHLPSDNRNGFSTDARGG